MTLFPQAQIKMLVLKKNLVSLTSGIKILQSDILVGASLTTGSRNVFIGNDATYSGNVSDRLLISNGIGSIIEGDFTQETCKSQETLQLEEIFQLDL